MVALTVNSTFDFTTSGLFAVDLIDFTKGGAIATFDASQFDGVSILDDVLVSGKSGPFVVNGIIVNGGGVDASGWNFANWINGRDTLTFNGTSGIDVYSGSSRKDVIFGNDGADTFNTSDGTGDEFYGGRGPDFFRYQLTPGPVIDVIDGGAGKADRLSVLGAGIFDFTGSTIIDVEELRFGSGTQSVILDESSAAASTGSIATVFGNGSVNRLEIRDAVDADLRDMTFLNWNDAVDRIRVIVRDAHNLQIVGSGFADELIAAGGSGLLSGLDGDDLISVSSSFTGTITGGNGTDVLLAANTGIGGEGNVIDLTGAAILFVEKLRFDNGANVLLDYIRIGVGLGFGTNILEVEGSSGLDTLQVTGWNIDLSPVTFSNWSGDIIQLHGTDINDNIVGSSQADTIDGGAGSDFIFGGGGDDIIILAGNDASEGEAGNDVFVARGIFTGMADGGTGNADRIEVDTAGLTADLVDATLLGIEKLTFAGDGTVKMAGASLGASGISTVTGSGGANVLQVFGDAIDLSGTAFVDWTAGRTEVFGTAGDDIIVGSNKSDVIDGGGGTDAIDAGTGADTLIANGFYGSLSGGDGYDVFVVNEGFYGTLDGGEGNADTIRLTTAPGIFAVFGTLSGIEILAFENGGNLLLVDGQFGPGGITTFIGTENQDTISFSTSFLDVGTLRFVDFGVSGPGDVITLLGSSAADTLRGSELREHASFQGGLDDFQFGGGNDNLMINSGFGAGSIADGGEGFDTISLTVNGPLVLDFRLLQVSGFEALFANGSNLEKAIFDGSQIGGSSSLQQVSAHAGYEIEVHGSLIDLSTVLFLPSALPATIQLEGTDGADTLTGSSEKDTLIGGLGNDTLVVRGSDVARGDGNADTLLVDGVLTGTLDGGGGLADAIGTVSGAIADVTQAILIGIEKLDLSFESGLTLRGDQIGGASALATVDGNGELQLSLTVTGAAIDLSSVAFVGWDQSNLVELFGTAGQDSLTGSDANDTVTGGAGGDTLTGGAGIDTLNYAGSAAGVAVNLKTGVTSGGDAQGDVISGFENIVGSSHGDTLTGDSADNRIEGGDGDDTIFASGGVDTVTGGLGDDTFTFALVSLSPPGAAADVIQDFSQAAGNRDVIKVSAIDAEASSAGTDEAFGFIGQDEFTAEGQIRAIQSGNDTIVQFNNTGTGGADMEIIVLNFTHTNLTASDFVL